MTIRVVIVDDHPMIRAGLTAVIGTAPDLLLVGEAQNGEEAVEQARALRPDVMLMDLGMPVLGGLSAIRGILQQHDDDTPLPRIIVLTVYAGDEDIRRALEAGASGYLLKDMAGTAVVNAIRCAARGERVMPQEVADQLAEFSAGAELTPRELEVLGLVAQGYRNRDIATAIGRSEETVKMHVKSLLAKLGAADRTEAAAVALKRGILHSS
jgi:DNA-binding NarL/FixJ family response regulator